MEQQSQSGRNTAAEAFALCGLTPACLRGLIAHVMHAGERLVYGDSKGHIIMLLCGTRVWPARDLICQDEYQDYIYIHQDHDDWVSQVRRARRQP